MRLSSHLNSRHRVNIIFAGLAVIPDPTQALTVHLEATQTQTLAAAARTLIQSQTLAMTLRGLETVAEDDGRLEGEAVALAVETAGPGHHPKMMSAGGVRITIPYNNPLAMPSRCNLIRRFMDVGYVCDIHCKQK